MSRGLEWRIGVDRSVVSRSVVRRGIVDRRLEWIEDWSGSYANYRSGVNYRS